ncbi:MAG TPA: hypothetical protein DD714_02835 [Candidatus Omnitrophica bacterium]|nr:hypothetical protein [Candidatus Omnitrophota bacterium]
MRLSHRCLVAVLLTATAQPVRAEEEVHAPRQRVKQLVAQGSYGEALKELDRLAPDDPVLQAYRMLCEKRLRAEDQWARLSSAQVAALQEALGREDSAQRRAEAQTRAVERQIQREQAAWDRQLEAAGRQIAVEQRAQEHAKRLEAARRRQAARLKRLAALRPSSTPPPPTPPPSIETPEPSQPAVAFEPAPPPQPSRVTVEIPPGSGERRAEGMGPGPAVPRPRTPGAVELESVQVQVVEPARVPEGPTPGPPRPPGAVQIFADHMTMVQERNLAQAQGHVRIEFEEGELTCDRLTLFTDTKDAYAEGDVRVRRGKELYRAELAHYNLNTHKGRFLQAAIAQPPWYEGGQAAEHLAEGVMRVTPGYLTSCSHEPPHYRFQGRTATVFAEEALVHGRHVTLFVEDFPLIYLPWLSVADRQSPFFFLPGKNKLWEQFVLMGYRYEWPLDHQGALRWDWRRAFGWGFGVDHHFDTPPEKFGKGLVKLYYNEERNMRRPESDLPKGAGMFRYRALVRHQWRPLPDTSMVTDYQRFSDEDFRKEFLFREEYLEDKISDFMMSTITSTEGYSLGLLETERVNRFNTLDETLQATLDVRPGRIGVSNLFSETKLDAVSFNTKRARSDNDTDAVRVDWFQRLRYALNWFRPVEVTPTAAVRQTYYTKDIQGGAERPQGKRDVLSGQFSLGSDASLKLFRIFPVASNVAGLNLNLLRHVVTPTVAYTYVHQPTAPSSLFSFSAAEGPSNRVTFGLENKLQTKRPSGAAGKLRSVDLARWTVSLPYTFRGNANKPGGRFGDWSFDLELTPWRWLRIESDWAYPSHFLKNSRDRRMTSWNLDVVMAGGRRGQTKTPSTGQPASSDHEALSEPEVLESRQSFEPGPRGALTGLLMPEGQWYLGFGHRYSHNDKTEEVVQFDWRLSKKWEIGTYHRLTFKQVAGGSKRFNNVRERQYILRRDLHDWIAEFVYRVDREFGEEVFFTLTLKAYPEMPIEIGETYHQPKLGSQSSPFSPVP